MKWLTLSLIKSHNRIETTGTLEDSVLETYGASAEDVILNITGRTVAELKAMNTTAPTEMPPAIIHASLLLVDLSYQMRSPFSMQHLYAVPYTFDILVKPYIRLADENDESNEESTE